MLSGYGGWPKMGNVEPAGRLLVTDGGERIYGYGRMSYRAGAGHVRPDATQDYRLFAEVLQPKPEPKQARRGRKPAGRRVIEWSRALPFIARCLVLTQDALLVGGGEFWSQDSDQPGPGSLWIASRKDGAKRGECKLPATPVLDGAIFADSGVFVTHVNGTVVGLGSAKQGG
jgi:hypothetical protein